MHRPSLDLEKGMSILPHRILTAGVKPLLKPIVVPDAFIKAFCTSRVFILVVVQEIGQPQVMEISLSVLGHIARHHVVHTTPESLRGVLTAASTVFGVWSQVKVKGLHVVVILNTM